MVKFIYKYSHLLVNVKQAAEPASKVAALARRCDALRDPTIPRLVMLLNTVWRRVILYVGIILKMLSALVSCLYIISRCLRHGLEMPEIAQLAYDKRASEVTYNLKLIGTGDPHVIEYLHYTRAV